MRLTTPRRALHLCRRHLAHLAVCAGTALSLASPVRAQTVQEAPGRVRVFLDCQTHGCDSREFRTEIDYVDWVREPAASDVHVILTRQNAGAGQEYVFDFIGRGGLTGVDDRLRHDAAGTATRDETVRGLTSVLEAGLVRYVARRGQSGALDIRYAAPASADPATAGAPQDDPWKLWVFSVGGDVNLEGEEQQSEQRYGAYLSASRTTPMWKVDISAGGDIDRSRVELSDGTYTSDTDSWDFDALVVRSVSGHWSTGAELSASTSTELNRSFGSRSAAALEWNYFPYEEANRRQLVVHYQLGVSRVTYEERTIFDKMQETLGDQRLAVAYSARQPWGTASAGAQYSNLLHDFSKYRISLGGDLDLRLTRGLSLRLDADWERIRDQVYLSAEELSDEDILTQRRQLGTSFEYDLGVGLRYRFGSIYNNVVNNRFPWDVRR